LSHQSRGDFCTTVFRGFPWTTVTRDPFGAISFRATVVGPGVTPDVRWSGPAPGANTSDVLYYPDGFTSENWLDGLTGRGDTGEATSWSALNDEQIRIATSGSGTDKCATVNGPH
jgi:hypothetical protein